MTEVLEKPSISELVVITEETALEAFSKENGLKDVVEKAKKETDRLLEAADLTTKKGRDAIASNARKPVKLKTTLDKLAVGSTEEMRQKIAAVNANRNYMKIELDHMRDKIRKPLTDWEEAEKKRVSDINDAIARIKNAGRAADPVNGNLLTLDELKQNKKYLEDFKVDDSFQEFKSEVEMIHQKSLDFVNQSIEAEEKRLSEQAELEQLRKEKEEREAKEYEEQLKEEARLEEAKRQEEEKARLKREAEEEKQRAEQAEKDAQEAKQRAEIEREEAEQRAEQQRLEAEENARVEKEEAAQREKEAAEKAERDLLQKQAEEAEEKRIAQEKLEANKKHVINIKNQAITSLNKIISKAEAERVIKAISEGKIDHVTINY